MEKQVSMIKKIFLAMMLLFLPCTHQSAFINKLKRGRKDAKQKSALTGLNKVLENKFVRIRAKNGRYLQTIWNNNAKKYALKLQEKFDPYDPRTKFLLQKKNNSLAITSKFAGENEKGQGRTLHGGLKPKGFCTFSKFTKDPIERWVFVGKSLSDCQIKNVKLNTFLMAGEDAVLANAKGSDPRTKVVIEILDPAPFRGLIKFSDKKLDFMTASKPHHVWGLSQNTAFKLETKSGMLSGKGSWKKVGAKLKQASVGLHGKIFGVNTKGQIVTLSGTEWKTKVSPSMEVGEGTTFHKGMPKFKKVEAGHKKFLYALDINGFLHQREQGITFHGGILKSKPWTKISDKTFVDISIGEDGKIWGIDTSGNPYINLELGTNAQQIKSSKKLKQISSGHIHNTWAIDSKGGVHWFTGTTFIQIPSSRFWIDGKKPKFKQVIAGTGKNKFGLSLYFIDTEKNIFVAKTPKWHYVPDVTLRDVSVIDEENVWGIGTDLKPYKFENNTWRKVSDQNFRHIAAGKNNVFAIDAKNYTYKYENERFVKINKGKSATIDAKKDVWRIGTNKKIYLWSGNNWKLKYGTFKCKDLSFRKGDNGYAIMHELGRTNKKRGLEDGCLYYFSSTKKPQKIDCSTKLKKIASTFRESNKGIGFSALSKQNEYGIGTSHELIHLRGRGPLNSYFPAKVIGHGIRSISAGEDGTVWGTTLNGAVIKIVKGPKEFAKEQVEQKKHRKKRLDEKKYPDFQKNLQNIRKEISVRRKIELYNQPKIATNIFKDQKHFDYFYKDLTQLVRHRKDEDISALQNFISSLIEKTKVSPSTNKDIYQEKLKKLLSKSKTPMHSKELVDEIMTLYTELSKTTKPTTTTMMKLNKLVNLLPVLIKRLHANHKIPLKGLLAKMENDIRNNALWLRQSKLKTKLVSLVKQIKAIKNAPRGADLIKNIVKKFKDKSDEAQTHISLAIEPGSEQDKWLQEFRFLTKEASRLPVKKLLVTHKAEIEKMREDDVLILAQDLYDALTSYQHLLTKAIDFAKSGDFHETQEDKKLDLYIKEGKNYYINLVRHAKNHVRVIFYQAEHRPNSFHILEKIIHFLSDNAKTKLADQESATTVYAALELLKKEIETKKIRLVNDKKTKIEKAIEPLASIKIQASPSVEETETAEAKEAIAKLLKQSQDTTQAIESRINFYNQALQKIDKNYAAQEELTFDEIRDIIGTYTKQFILMTENPKIKNNKIILIKIESALKNTIDRFTMLTEDQNERNAIKSMIEPYINKIKLNIEKMHRKTTPTPRGSRRSRSSRQVR